MKRLEVNAKTKVGVVKFPPKMAVQGKKWAREQVLMYLYNKAVSPDFKKTILAIAKQSGVSVVHIKKAEQESYFKDDPSVGLYYDWDGIPNSYFSYTMQQKKEIPFGIVSLVFDWTRIKYPKDASKWKWHSQNDYWEGVYMDAAGLIVLSPKSSINEIFAAERTMLASKEKWASEKDDKYLKSFETRARITVEHYIDEIDETVEHELRHFVQHKLLPPEQNKMFKGYNKKGGGSYGPDYFLSPVEFGPALKTVTTRFYKDTVLSMRRMKALALGVGRDLTDTDFSLFDMEMNVRVFTGELTYDEARAKLKVQGGNGTLFGQEPNEMFAVLKARKPTAYAKAVSYVNRKILPALITELNRLKKQKTVQTRRKKEAYARLG